MAAIDHNQGASHDKDSEEQIGDFKLVDIQ